MRRVIILYSTWPPGVISTSPSQMSPLVHFSGMASSGFQAPNSLAPPMMAISWPYITLEWISNATLTFFLASFFVMLSEPPNRPAIVSSAPPSYSCTVRLWCFSQWVLPCLSLTSTLYSTCSCQSISTLPFHTSPSDHLRYTPSRSFHRPSLEVLPTTHTWSP